MRPQDASLGVNMVYVTVTIPASGAAATLGSIIAAGTDQATGATLADAKYKRILNVQVTDYVGTIKYGGLAGTTPLSWPANTPMSRPSTQWHLDTFVASSAGSFTAYAQCVLEAA